MNYSPGGGEIETHLGPSVQGDDRYILAFIVWFVKTVEKYVINGGGDGTNLVTFVRISMRNA